MADSRILRIPIYLSCRVAKDRTGTAITFRERRLIAESADDRVIAVITAPRGTRVRKRPDRHGQDQLVVPRSPGFWGRLFGRRISIPAKYVIGDARSRSYGLALVDLSLPEAEHPEVAPTPASKSAGVEPSPAEVTP